MSTPAVTVKQSDLAKALGVDPALVTRYKARGMPVHSIAAAQQWKIENVRSKVPAVGQAEKPSPVTAPQLPLAAPDAGQQPDAPQAATGYSVDRARREKYEADLAEIKLREQQGDLVRRSDVRVEIAARLGEVRTNLLQIPARMAPLLAPETDQAKVHQLLDAELRNVLIKLTA